MIYEHFKKRPVKLMQWVKISHSLFAVCAKSVPRYHFMLAHVVLEMAVKEFFEIHFQNGDIGRFNRFLLIELF